MFSSDWRKGEHERCSFRNQKKQSLLSSFPIQFEGASFKTELTSSESPQPAQPETKENIYNLTSWRNYEEPHFRNALSIPFRT